MSVNFNKSIYINDFLGILRHIRTAVTYNYKLNINSIYRENSEYKLHGSEIKLAVL